MIVGPFSWKGEMHGVLIFFDFFVSYFISFALFLREIAEQFIFNSEFIKKWENQTKTTSYPFFLFTCVCVCIIQNNPSLNVSASLRVAPPCGYVLFSFHSFCYNVVREKEGQAKSK